MEFGQYQFMFRKGSEWRGYNKNFGVVIPDSYLLILLRRTVFTNIALINATNFTKPVDQEYYEVSGNIVETSIPSSSDIDELLILAESYKLKNDMSVMYTYDAYCVMYDGYDRFIFFTNTPNGTVSIRVIYDENNEVFSEFLQVLLNIAEDFDISTLSTIIKSTKYNRIEESDTVNT